MAKVGPGWQGKAWQAKLGAVALGSARPGKAGKALSDLIEVRARRLAAQKMNLEHDTYGSRLPDDLWRQALPQAVHEYRFEVLQKLRAEFIRAPKQGYPVQDWQLRQWVGWIDEFKAFETPAERDLRLSHSSPADLTDDELDALDVLSPGAKDREQTRREKAAREAACPGHEAVAEPVSEGQRMHGWHPAHCKHCGKDMSIDSGD